MIPPTFATDTITLESLAADGRYGPTYQPARTVGGVRVEVGRKLVPSAAGEELVSAARVWVGPEGPQIVPGDRITLTEGHSGLVLSVDAYRSPGQLGHAEVSLS